MRGNKKLGVAEVTKNPYGSHRVAAKGQPTYDALCETVRTSAVVVPDETGWNVRGLLQWLWVFATTMTTVYRICPRPRVCGLKFAKAVSDVNNLRAAFCG